MEALMGGDEPSSSGGEQPPPESQEPQQPQNNDSVAVVQQQSPPEEGSSLVRETHASITVPHPHPRHEAVSMWRRGRQLTRGNPTYNRGMDNQEHDYIAHVGDHIVNPSGVRYQIEDSLGAGTYGQVLLCQRLPPQPGSSRRPGQVALKVIKNRPPYFKQAVVEVKILDILMHQHDPDDSHNIVRMVDFFVFRSHLCIAFEVLNMNLFELIKANNHQGIPLRAIRTIASQLLQALQVLEEAGIIHCDLKPENVCLSNEERKRVKLIDFGSACPLDQTVFTYIQSRFYRSPEVLLGLPYTHKIDVWSLGCICAELFLGHPIFPGQSEFDQLHRIVDLLGEPPEGMLRRGQKVPQFFRVSSEDLEVSESCSLLSSRSSDSGKESPSRQSLSDEERGERESVGSRRSGEGEVPMVPPPAEADHHGHVPVFSRSEGEAALGPPEDDDELEEGEHEGVDIDPMDAQKEDGLCLVAAPPHPSVMSAGALEVEGVLGERAIEGDGEMEEGEIEGESIADDECEEDEEGEVGEVHSEEEDDGSILVVPGEGDGGTDGGDDGERRPLTDSFTFQGSPEMSPLSLPCVAIRQQYQEGGEQYIDQTAEGVEIRALQQGDTVPLVVDSTSEPEKSGKLDPPQSSFETQGVGEHIAADDTATMQGDDGDGDQTCIEPSAAGSASLPRATAPATAGATTDFRQESQRASTASSFAFTASALSRTGGAAASGMRGPGSAGPSRWTPGGAQQLSVPMSSGTGGSKGGCGPSSSGGGMFPPFGSPHFPPLSAARGGIAQVRSQPASVGRQGGGAGGRHHNVVGSGGAGGPSGGSARGGLRWAASAPAASAGNSSAGDACTPAERSSAVGLSPPSPSPRGMSGAEDSSRRGETVGRDPRGGGAGAWLADAPESIEGGRVSGGGDQRTAVDDLDAPLPPPRSPHSNSAPPSILPLALDDCSGGAEQEQFYGGEEDEDCTVAWGGLDGSLSGVDGRAHFLPLGTRRRAFSLSEPVGRAQREREERLQRLHPQSLQGEGGPVDGDPEVEGEGDGEGDAVTGPLPLPSTAISEASRRAASMQKQQQCGHGQVVGGTAGGTIPQTTHDPASVVPPGAFPGGLGVTQALILPQEASGSADGPPPPIGHGGLGRHRGSERKSGRRHRNLVGGRGTESEGVPNDLRVGVLGGEQGVPGDGGDGVGGGVGAVARGSPRGERNRHHRRHRERDRVGVRGGGEEPAVHQRSRRRKIIRRLRFKLKTREEFEQDTRKREPSPRRYRWQVSSLEELTNRVVSRGTASTAAEGSDGNEGSVDGSATAGKGERGGNEKGKGAQNERENFVQFLKGLLELDPDKRWSARQAALHPYILNAKFAPDYQPPEQPRLEEPGDSRHSRRRSESEHQLPVSHQLQHQQQPQQPRSAAPAAMMVGVLPLPGGESGDAGKERQSEDQSAFREKERDHDKLAPSPPEEDAVGGRDGTAATAADLQPQPDVGGVRVHRSRGDLFPGASSAQPMQSQQLSPGTPPVGGQRDRDRDREGADGGHAVLVPDPSSSVVRRLRAQAQAQAQAQGVDRPSLRSIPDSLIVHDDDEAASMLLENYIRGGRRGTHACGITRARSQTPSGGSSGVQSRESERDREPRGGGDQEPLLRVRSASPTVHPHPPSPPSDGISAPGSSPSGAAGDFSSSSAAAAPSVPVSSQLDTMRPHVRGVADGGSLGDMVSPVGALHRDLARGQPQTEASRRQGAQETAQVEQGQPGAPARTEVTEMLSWYNLFKEMAVQVVALTSNQSGGTDRRDTASQPPGSAATATPAAAAPQRSLLRPGGPTEAAAGSRSVGGSPQAPLQTLTCLQPSSSLLDDSSPLGDLHPPHAQQGGQSPSALPMTTRTSLVPHPIQIPRLAGAVPSGMGGRGGWRLHGGGGGSSLPGGPPPLRTNGSEPPTPLVGYHPSMMGGGGQMVPPGAGGVQAGMGGSLARAFSGPSSPLGLSRQGVIAGPGTPTTPGQGPHGHGGAGPPLQERAASTGAVFSGVHGGGGGGSAMGPPESSLSALWDTHPESYRPPIWELDRENLKIYIESKRPPMQQVSGLTMQNSHLAPSDQPGPSGGGGTRIPGETRDPQAARPDLHFFLHPPRPHSDSFSAGGPPGGGRERSHRSRGAVPNSQDPLTGPLGSMEGPGAIGMGFQGGVSTASSHPGTPRNRRARGGRGRRSGGGYQEGSAGGGPRLSVQTGNPQTPGAASRGSAHSDQMMAGHDREREWQQMVWHHSGPAPSGSSWQTLGQQPQSHGSFTPGTRELNRLALLGQFGRDVGSGYPRSTHSGLSLSSPLRPGAPGPPSPGSVYTASNSNLIAGMPFGARARLAASGSLSFLSVGSGGGGVAAGGAQSSRPGSSEIGEAERHAVHQSFGRSPGGGDGDREAGPWNEWMSANRSHGGSAGLPSSSGQPGQRQQQHYHPQQSSGGGGGSSSSAWGASHGGGGGGYGGGSNTRGSPKFPSRASSNRATPPTPPHPYQSHPALSHIPPPPPAPPEGLVRPRGGSNSSGSYGGKVHLRHSPHQSPASPSAGSSCSDSAGAGGAGAGANQRPCSAAVHQQAARSPQLQPGNLSQQQQGGHGHSPFVGPAAAGHNNNFGSQGRAARGSGGGFSVPSQPLPPPAVPCGSSRETPRSTSANSPFPFEGMDSSQQSQNRGPSLRSHAASMMSKSSPSSQQGGGGRASLMLDPAGEGLYIHTSAHAGGGHIHAVGGHPQGGGGASRMHSPLSTSCSHTQPPSSPTTSDHQGHGLLEFGPSSTTASAGTGGRYSQSQVRTPSHGSPALSGGAPIARSSQQEGGNVGSTSAQQPPSESAAGSGTPGLYSRGSIGGSGGKGPRKLSVGTGSSGAAGGGAAAGMQTSPQAESEGMTAGDGGGDFQDLGAGASAISPTEGNASSSVSPATLPQSRSGADGGPSRGGGPRGDAVAPAGDRGGLTKGNKFMSFQRQPNKSDFRTIYASLASSGPVTALRPGPSQPPQQQQQQQGGTQQQQPSAVSSAGGGTNQQPTTPTSSQPAGGGSGSLTSVASPSSAVPCMPVTSAWGQTQPQQPQHQPGMQSSSHRMMSQQGPRQGGIESRGSASSTSDGGSFIDSLPLSAAPAPASAWASEKDFRSAAGDRGMGSGSGSRERDGGSRGSTGQAAGGYGGRGSHRRTDRDRDREKDSAKGKGKPKGPGS
uniref:Protein kinase domain-containing protein n=1 Tax=Chromera velia CCMP2878 TaxID=1169474 RepID=A0A0G4FMV7_9ALVE|eukprot:Cvel_17859.t1-p1 / transcript=Cvel_17859.t1 / gene=Cvel_17859 / organism=Chromera_velia_CCMP2878 / gene_product=Serine/threonine-protein kinase ppk15, putative / transcript_product=Serine/threonine-protein kinase ppk15, putative / location=Cvel_scaffold1448:24629-36001(+) / protein_length=3172 / sequence_SO=supercontig / SO=protein_coding / is_pseudo=false